MAQPSPFLLSQPREMLRSVHRGAKISLVVGPTYPSCGTSILFMPCRPNFSIPKERKGDESLDPRRQVYRWAGKLLDVHMKSVIGKIGKGEMRLPPILVTPAFSITEESGGKTTWLFFSPVITGITNFKTNMKYLQFGAKEAVLEAGRLGPGMSISFPVYKAKKGEIRISQKVSSFCQGAKDAAAELSKKGIAPPEIIIFLQKNAEKFLSDAVIAFSRIFSVSP